MNLALGVASRALQRRLSLAWPQVAAPTTGTTVHLHQVQLELNQGRMWEGVKGCSFINRGGV